MRPLIIVLLFLSSFSVIADDNFSIKLDGSFEGYAMEIDTYSFTTENYRDVTVSSFYYHPETIASDRPVVFLLNGGPSVSAIILNMGGLGPKYVPIEQPGQSRKKMVRSLQDNPDSLLTDADLVFIDPPDTGYNPKTKRSVGAPVIPGEQGQVNQAVMFNEQDDIDDLYTYIDHFIAEHGLFKRRIFILGESYGAHRAAAISKRFTDHMQPLDGLILIGPAMSSRLFVETPDIYLSAISAVFEYRNHIPSQNETELRNFVLNSYPSALRRYPEIPEDEETKVVTKLNELTLLPANTLLHNDLAFTLFRVMDNLFELEHQKLDYYDARYAVSSKHLSVEDNQLQSDLILLKFGSAVHLFRGWLAEHGYRESQPFDWMSKQPQSEYYSYKVAQGATDMNALYDSLIANPESKVMLVCGKYDFVVPCRQVERITHQLRKNFPERVSLDVYNTGHMPYIDPVERCELVHRIKAMLAK